MIDFSKIKTYPIAKRGNKSEIEDFASAKAPIPDILAGAQFKEMVAGVAQAAKEHRQIIIMMGGHVIKCGLAPLLIDLMRKGVITHIAMNGAASIHDFEIALQGATSEDVAKGLKDGSFGMVEETGALMNEAIKQGQLSKQGQGHALGALILQKKMRHSEKSILAMAYELKIPVTVHVAIGTDIIHQHPSCDGAALGETSFRDFKILTESVCGLEGGVIMNLGSAVVLPEVFLKALTIARNLGYPAKDFIAVNFDMLAQYRPLTNVVQRPTQDSGKGYSFIGQHELLIPLFYQHLISALEGTHA